MDSLGSGIARENMHSTAAGLFAHWNITAGFSVIKKDWYLLVPFFGQCFELHIFAKTFDMFGALASARSRGLLSS